MNGVLSNQPGGAECGASGYYWNNTTGTKQNNVSAKKMSQCLESMRLSPKSHKGWNKLIVHASVTVRTIDLQSVIMRLPCIGCIMSLRVLKTKAPALRHGLFSEMAYIRRACSIIMLMRL